MSKFLNQVKIFITLVSICFVMTQSAYAQDDNSLIKWQSPSKDIMKVMYAPKLPWVWTSPTGKHLFLANPIYYPTLAELAAPMHKLAGRRVNPSNNGYHAYRGGTSPRLLRIKDKKIIKLKLPKKAEVHGVKWTADGKRFALTVGFYDRFELWVGSIHGDVKKIDKLRINPLFGGSVSWLPDQKRLLIRIIPKRGPVPKPPVIPVGPEIYEGAGAGARSTYEARNLLTSAYDEKLFEYYSTSRLCILDPDTGKSEFIGKPAIFAIARFSPDGKYILTKRLVKPWSREVTWRRFANEIEVWDAKGKMISKIASLPVADNVPVHGVPLGPRFPAWRPTSPNQIYWVEALDGGNPVSVADYRDRLMCLEEPFTSNPKEIFKAKHRILPWMNTWGDKGMLMITQRQRMKRKRHVWILQTDRGTSKLWFELDENDRYRNPGHPVYRMLPNGKYVLRQKDDRIYFRGSGATSKGDRPFLDLRSTKTGKTERLFRCDPDRYEYFVAFAGDEENFILRSESPTDVPNYYMARFDKTIKASKGEATRSLKRKPITKFKDPTPELRKIKKKLVHYKRKDGVKLSFNLHLPPNYKKGTKLPTVLYAYPREYSGATTAGQVRGSTKRFMRLYGSSHMYFLLKGYAVMDRVSMPMIGDPETTYDTFVEQLIANAEAAVAKAVEIGVADPNKIGIIGHSHGGLMVANLLAHTDLFCAGIARSGSYNKTNQPFGFQSERRSLFKARDVYIQVSPTFFADKVNEPILIIHGSDDSNPGTLTFQSKVFYEAVRGMGGNARLILLPFEDHGYRAKESIEHVVWEQLRWFEKYVKHKGKKK